MEYKPVEYPVFRRMDGNVIAGISGRTALLAAAAALLGVVLYAALGLVTVTEEREAGYAEAAAVAAEYEQMRDASRFMEIAGALATPELAGDAELELEAEMLLAGTLRGLDVEDVAAIAEEAREAGVTADMGAGELEGLMPLVGVEEVPALSGYCRLVVALVPLILTVALNYEANGVSAIRKIRNHRDYGRSQREYFYRPDGRVGKGESR